MMFGRLARVGAALLHEARVGHVVSQRGSHAGVGIGVPVWEAARLGFVHSGGSMRSFASTPSRSTTPATAAPAGVSEARQRLAARYEGTHRHPPAPQPCGGRLAQP
jgi:hypothetical protein